MYTYGGKYFCEEGFENFIGCEKGLKGSYVGYFHTTENEGLMAGREHISGPHPKLTTLKKNNKPKSIGER